MDNMGFLSNILTTIFLACFFKSSLGAPVNNPIHLEKISTLYLPYTYEGSMPLYKFDSGAVEQMAHDPTDQVVYLVGSSILHIVDINDVGSPKVLHQQLFSNVDVTDIEFCGGYVFVAFDNQTDRENGHVKVFRKFNVTSKGLEEVNSVRVGALPDMIKPKSDCRTVLVAIEAEGYSDGTTFTDPEGGVGIIKFSTDMTDMKYTYKKLDFKKYNSRWQNLVNRGARFVYREKGNSFSNDVEPEYIDYNADETKAYISLQENNAVAEIDLATETIVDIYPLGYKDWSKYGLDASDKDGKINIKPWPVYGMRLPDAIHIMELNGKSFLVTANEGDSKDYSELPGADGWTEEVRVEQIWDEVEGFSSPKLRNSAKGGNVLKNPIADWVYKNGYNGTIQDTTNLGRLTISNIDGRNNGTFSNLYSYGGRGFSIFNLDDMSLVYDSDSFVENKIREQSPSLFNTNPHGSFDDLSILFDTRSDNKGPETESLATANFKDLVVLFVGHERPGFISIHSVRGNGSDVTFESMWSGIKDTNGTWEELYERKLVADIDPEDIRFVMDSESPNNQHILLVAGSISGTLSIFQVNGIDAAAKKPSASGSSYAPGAVPPVVG